MIVFTSAINSSAWLLGFFFSRLYQDCTFLYTSTFHKQETNCFSCYAATKWASTSIEDRTLMEKFIYNGSLKKHKWTLRADFRQTLDPSNLPWMFMPKWGLGLFPRAVFYCRICIWGYCWRNQHHQIKLIALVPAQRTPASTQEGKELKAGECITGSD